VRKLFAGVAFFGVFALMTSSASASFSYTFDSSAQGWRDFFPQGPNATDAAWSASSGNPGGAISLTSDDSNPGLIVSPAIATFEGDHSNNFGGTLSVDVKANPASVAMSGYGGLLFGPDNAPGLCFFDAATPGTTFHTYDFTLNTANLRSTASNCQQAATNAEIATVLADLKQIQFSGYALISGSQTTTIDNVTLSGGGPPPNVTVSRTLTLAYSKKKKAFSGKLKAPKDPDTCAAKQKVSVFKKRKGPDLKLGSPKTNASGSYTLKNSGKKGTYYSSVPSAKHGITTCKAAKSDTVQIT
jgi:hypothetical protein